MPDLLMLAGRLAPEAFALAAPVIALAMMGAGMIAAAVSGRLRTGVLLAGAGGSGLIVLGVAAGMPLPARPLWAVLAIILAGVSFAARGALFARSAGRKGWLIAAGVVAGEATMLLTATAMPGALPGWLLALLPAQWASLALAAAFSGTRAAAVIAAILALGSTAAATLLVRHLWPRRWPYAVMFTTWLAASALVWHAP